ncbi:hypothetical protein RJZ90_007406 [Blastomyces dermatitidis]
MASNDAHQDTQFPSATTPRDNSITRHGFKITTQKLPILKAGPIDEMTTKLGIAPPEMIFGDNHVTIEHQPSGWKLDFNAFDALDRVDKSGETMLKVAYSKEWQQSSTNYKGTLSPGGKPFENSSSPIPIELLKRPDPILFFDEVMLYEDELADNGIAMLSCKIRVMPSRLLLLSRFFMRLDNVLVRLRDTRIYVDFETREVIREYQAKEEKYDEVRQRLVSSREDIPAIMRDPNKLSELLPKVDASLEHVFVDG